MSAFPDSYASNPPHLNPMRIVNRSVKEAIGSAICARQRDTGRCEVRMIERTRQRSSKVSQKPSRSGSIKHAMAQPAITRTQCGPI